MIGHVRILPASCRPMEIPIHTVRVRVLRVEMSTIRFLALAALLFIGSCHALMAATIVGLTVDNRLRHFESSAPGVVTSTATISGLQPGEHIVAIDFRPLTGRLYGLGDSSRLYLINPVSGAASAVGTAFTPALSGVEFGFDFNPTVDRIRVVSNTGQNLRLNPDTGAVVATDSVLIYAPGDVNSGVTPYLSAVAYANSYAGAATTTLYGIDASLNVLVIQTPPNAGVLNTVGPLGEDPNGIVGFDIWDLNGQAFAAITPFGEAASKLFTIDLSSGLAALGGVIGGGTVIQDLAVVPAGCSLEFSGQTYPVSESEGAALIGIVRRGSSSGPVAITLQTIAGTAGEGIDYTPVSKLVSFADGETNQTVSIPIVNDGEAELTETVKLVLSAGSESIHDSRRAAVLSIESIDPLRVYAVTTNNNLLYFDRTPAAIVGSVAISGLQPLERMSGIDFRPVNGRLYGLGSSSRLYLLNETNGIASQVGTAPFSPALSGTDFGFDFNPVVDRVRVVSVAGQNLRLNPDTGGLAGQDTALNYAAGDVNSGAVPRLVASAYSQNFSGTTSTVLYGLDSGTDVLVIQNPPNAGTLTTIGGLGLNLTDETGFDFVETGGGTALASLNVFGTSTTGLYRIDLAAGTARLIGQFGTAETIRDLAIAPSPAGLAVQLSGGGVILSWPAGAAGYFLQSSASLFPATWSDVSDVPVINGSRRVITNVVSGTGRYYRLGR